MRVVLDTNVLISAILWKGKAHQLLPLIERGRITPCFSPETFEEFQEVLARRKFKSILSERNLTAEDILIPMLVKAEVFRFPKPHLKIIEEDPADDMFLFLAQAAKARYLVSGDKHLLKLARFGNIRIISVSEFLQLLK